jgi:outer membrane protein TolC
VAVQFDIDPAKAAARARQAQATGEQVEAMRRFAETGIPMQVRLAFQTLATLRESVTLDARAERAAKKWMTFSAAAYATGTGEAKDLLEGVVAYLQSKASYHDNLSKFWIALAELDQAVGRAGDVPEEQPAEPPPARPGAVVP